MCVATGSVFNMNDNPLLGGTIPSSIGTLAELMYEPHVHVSCAGTIPFSSALTSDTVMSQCLLCCALTGITTLYPIRFLSLAHNALSGTVPNIICEGYFADRDFSNNPSLVVPVNCTVEAPAPAQTDSYYG